MENRKKFLEERIKTGNIPISKNNEEEMEESEDEEKYKRFS